MLAPAARALGDVFTPPFRAVLVKTLLLTLVALTVVWAAGTRAFAALAAWFAAAHPLDYPWWVDAFTTVAGVVSGILLFVVAAYLIAPVSAMVAGFYLDEIADTVERTAYPHDPPGRSVPLGASIGAALEFALAALAVNLVAFALLLVPGVNLVAFFAGNGYLLGREYFVMAAMRLMDAEAARSLRERNAFAVFAAGLAVAAFLSVPVLNLLTPLFATALMVHLVKALTGSRAAARSP